MKNTKEKIKDKIWELLNDHVYLEFNDNKTRSLFSNAANDYFDTLLNNEIFDYYIICNNVEYSTGFRASIFIKYNDESDFDEIKVEYLPQKVEIGNFID